MGATTTIPLAEAKWGMYGEVTGFGPDGGPATHAGFITRLPELHDGSIAGGGRHSARDSGALLSFALERPRTPTHGGVYIGMYAATDAVLRLLPTPEKLPDPDPSMKPFADLRRGDTYYVWDEEGTPRRHVQGDPQTAGDGTCTVTVVIGDEVTLHAMPANLWVDVEDPERCRWKSADECPTQADLLDLDAPADAVTVVDDGPDEFDLDVWVQETLFDLDVWAAAVAGTKEV